MPHILLLESVSPAAGELLSAQAEVHVAPAPDAGGPLADRHPIHAIVTRGKGDVSADLIGRCPNLRVIARCGVGLDNVAIASATSRGVYVVNAPGSNAATVAEHTLGLILSLQRRIHPAANAVAAGNWGYRNGYGGDEIRGKTLGILGMGNIGQRVARLATAFGMEVVFWNASRRDLPYAQLPYAVVLQRADILSLHLPLTDATRRLLDAAALRLLPDHALVINTARGEIIDQAALVEALRRGRIGGFAADVLATEPPAANDPLLSLDNVLLTPHTASLTARTFDEMCVLTVRNTLALLAGEPIDPKYIFNRSALGRY